MSVHCRYAVWWGVVKVAIRVFCRDGHRLKYLVTCSGRSSPSGPAACDEGAAKRRPRSSGRGLGAQPPNGVQGAGAKPPEKFEFLRLFYAIL